MIAPHLVGESSFAGKGASSGAAMLANSLVVAALGFATRGSSARAMCAQEQQREPGHAATRGRPSATIVLGGTGAGRTLVSLRGFGSFAGPRVARRARAT
jgi:hypothetical protein